MSVCIGGGWLRSARGVFSVAAGSAMLAASIVSGAYGQLTLSPGITLVEEGPAAVTAGDPVPMNLATGAIPFSSSDLGPQLGLAYHVAANLNDGTYGNAFSWIGGDDNPFAPIQFGGIDLGAGPVSNVQSLALGRSNVLSGDPCGGEVCTDRHMGLYTLQYTQVADPSTDLGLGTTGDPVTGWVDIGTLEYGASEGLGTNYNNTWQRHRYNFDAVDATGIRLLVGGGTAIDEIELYDVPGELVEPPAPPPAVIIEPTTGFQISWDRNDGDHFDPVPPPDGSLVPDNLALTDNGAVSFSSSDLGPQLGIGFHVAGNINDGFYGNSNSWIGGDDNPFAPLQFVGVNLGGLFDIRRVAWGRDNGNGAVDDSDPGTDACGGQCDDRSLGLYTLQYTTAANPDANTPDTGDAALGWATIGSVNYSFNEDGEVGGGFTSYLRHAFDVSRNGEPIPATGLRLLVPASGLGGGTAIDEFEVYPIPEPSALVLALLGVAGVLTYLGRGKRRV